MRNAPRRSVETAIIHHSERESLSLKNHAESADVTTVAKSPIVLAKFAATVEYETSRKPVQRARNTAIETQLENDGASCIRKSFPKRPSLTARQALRAKNTASAVRKIDHSAKKRLQTGDAILILTTTFAIQKYAVQLRSERSGSQTCFNTALPFLFSETRNAATDAKKAEAMARRLMESDSEAGKSSALTKYSTTTYPYAMERETPIGMCREEARYA